MPRVQGSKTPLRLPASFFAFSNDLVERENNHSGTESNPVIFTQP